MYIGVVVRMDEKSIEERLRKPFDAETLLTLMDIQKEFFEYLGRSHHERSAIYDASKKVSPIIKKPHIQVKRESKLMFRQSMKKARNCVREHEPDLQERILSVFEANMKHHLEKSDSCDYSDLKSDILFRSNFLFNSARELYVERVNPLDRLDDSYDIVEKNFDDGDYSKAKETCEALLKSIVAAKAKFGELFLNEGSGAMRFNTTPRLDDAERTYIGQEISKIEGKAKKLYAQIEEKISPAGKSND